jgi:hypothetical protein
MIDSVYLEMIDNRSAMTSMGRNKKLRQDATDATAWLPPDAPLYIRLLAIRDFTESSFPKCYCGRQVTWNKATMKLSVFCSGKCSSNRDYLSDAVTSKLKDFTLMYSLRITKKYSKEYMGELLGVSITVIDKWLKYHKIPEIRYNESNPKAQAFLLDRNWMETQHVEMHRTVQDIAEEIGSSSSTVSIHLRRHGIKTNAPNSYDRESGTSKQCQDIADFILSLGLDVKLNDRRILNGYELDIVVESRKFCIEYNGLYHHIHRPEAATHAAKKGASYHVGKHDVALMHGYSLFHIFSDSWEQHPDIVKSMIQSKLGFNTRIGARNLEIKEISGQDRRIFFNNNHLQGDARSSISYGLIDKSTKQIMCAMSFSPARFSRKYKWELIRYACNLNTNVSGGFSRILKHFERLHDGSIVSYADLCYSEGAVYKKHGFELISRNPPSYSYVDPDCTKRYHRSRFMKSSITTPDDPRSERNIMLDRGYHIIWDCGTLTFVKNNA